MNIVEVFFKEYCLSMFFNNNINDLVVNDYVIVSSDKGELFGKVSNVDISTDDISGDIIRKVDDNDYDNYLRNCRYAKNALRFSKEKAKELDLNMSFVDAVYNFDRSQLLIYFTSEERVDFRELVKIIARKFRTRIDLRQIGVRDKSKIVSGIGHCGRELCCGCFLNDFAPVSIGMAKNQGIALNPAKINGACGRLLCCLAYEDDVYCDYRNNLPNVGDFVSYCGSNYKVLNVNVLKKSCNIMVDNEIKEVFFDEK